MHDLDPKAIAARIRGIIAGQADGMVDAVARRLGVSEVAFRMTIDPDEPHPTIEVMAAVAAYYGVDPVWLLSGEYDATTHRAAIAEDGRGARQQVARIIARRLGTETPGEGISGMRREA